MTYTGNRENLQYLSVNTSSAAGRASSISRDFWGSDLRWDNTGKVFNLPYNLSMGLTYGKMDDERLDINTDGGVKRPIISGNGNFALNRDEDNISTNSDQYIQGKISLSDKFDIHAGARRTKVILKVNDNFLTGSANNGNNSGSVDYKKTTPVIGAIWKVTPTLNLYANYGKGFETPTFIEAAYNSVDNGAPNLSLKPSESTNYELGLKAFVTNNHQMNINLFKIDTDDEIVTKETNAANRSVFGNANKTKRKGVELSIDSQYDNNLSTYLAYSFLDAKFDSDFTYIPSSGIPTTIQSGNKIPGTYRSQIYGEVAWKYAPLGFKTAVEARYNSKVYVNDINTDAARSYTIFNMRAGFEQNLTNWRFTEYLRVENILDKDYIGSVRINDSNLRFFEPAAGINYLLGVSALYRL